MRFITILTSIAISVGLAAAVPQTVCALETEFCSDFLGPICCDGFVCTGAAKLFSGVCVAVPESDD